MADDNVKKKAEDEEPEGAPEWMVSFCDCMTLLLTFFVLLLSFASFDKETLPIIGQSFAQALPTIGLSSKDKQDSMFKSQASNDQNKQIDGTETRTDSTSQTSNFMKEKKPLDFRNLKVFTVESEKFFWGNASAISNEGRDILDALAEFLNHQTGRIVISENGPDGDTALGMRRGMAMMNYLINKHKIEKDRFNLTAATTMKRGPKERSVEITLLDRSVYETSRRPEEKKPGVPAYIVTFSDMITLLLTFFVMLLSMAQTQVDEHKFLAGCASFKRAIADFGVSGFLISRASGPEMEHPKPKYRVAEGEDEKQDRSIDAETENVRRILMEVERMMKISPSQIVGMEKNFLQSDITFPKNSGQLDRESQKKIIKLFEQIRINYAMQDPIIYVLGLAGDVKDDQQQWVISAERANAVADFMRTQLPENSQWPVFSWGAGDGGQWTGYKGQVTKNAHIMITVMTETK